MKHLIFVDVLHWTIMILRNYRRSASKEDSSVTTESYRSKQEDLSEVYWINLAMAEIAEIPLSGEFTLYVKYLCMNVSLSSMLIWFKLTIQMLSKMRKSKPRALYPFEMILLLAGLFLWSSGTKKGICCTFDLKRRTKTNQDRCA